MAQYANFFADCPPDLLSPLTLLTRGTKNKRWNEIAIDVFKARGMTATVAHLERVKRMLNSPISHAESDWFWRNATPAPRGSWLNHTFEIGVCRDCGHNTFRRFNGYWQCKDCADAIKRAGSRENWRIDKLAKAFKAAKEQAA